MNRAENGQNGLREDCVSIEKKLKHTSIKHITHIEHTNNKQRINLPECDV